MSAPLTASGNVKNTSLPKATTSPPSESHALIPVVPTEWPADMIVGPLARDPAKDWDMGRLTQSLYRSPEALEAVTEGVQRFGNSCTVLVVLSEDPENDSMPFLHEPGAGGLRTGSMSPDYTEDRGRIDPFPRVSL